MALASDRTRIGLRRHFSRADVHPYDEVEWHRRDARITSADGEVAFEQTDVEFPQSWSVNAENIVAQKYFRGGLGTPEREASLRQVIDRVVDTLVAWGTESGHLAEPEEAEAFGDELRWLLVRQRAAFNSPVWFNLGVPGAVPQSSACFILSVDDTMESILDWYGEEGRIFKGGSGAGVNLSRIRSSRETMSGGGAPSGPVSFMRGADASAGTIKSGGKTRRAAKMVVLDADHPDVSEFIWCKAVEERKARALRDAGFDMDLDGADVHSIQYQNANNSVRLSDEFMSAAVDDGEWQLTARTTGEVLETVPARSILTQIAEAAWECADPGVQFETTINRWNTAAKTGRITASNPCSEYLHLDNSACNLSSLNLLSFVGDDGVFDTDGFSAAVRVMTVAQEILVGPSHYPTEQIGVTTRRFRQLGLGYANLGAMLMALGLAYDSDEGRGLAASVTALMTGVAYETSGRMAARLGPFKGFAENQEPTQRVLRMHRDALNRLEGEPVPPDVLNAARTAWDAAVEWGDTVGVRNSQATVLAPTGTISFMMDCDTTGIEPDLGLVKTKKLVGGGTMPIVNQTVDRALHRLGYSPDQVTDIEAHVHARGTVVGAPHLEPAHLPVFACSMGDNVISPSGHVKMMAAVQPWLSGGISKTVNVPEDTTAGEIEQLFVDAWQMGVKALAVYRDNCKLGQPLSVSDASAAQPEQTFGSETAPAPQRRRLPRLRTSRTFEFRVADCKGFATVGEYEDGSPGEIFIRVSKQGTTLAGFMDSFAMAVSHGLQYGVPLRAYVDAFTGMRFEPAGMTDDPDIRIATSLIDYLFRRLAVEYLEPEERHELAIFTTDERIQPTLPGVEEQVPVTVPGDIVEPDPPSPYTRRTPLDAHAPVCYDCGVLMIRAGSCHACPDCGSTSGCS
ncbi:MAG: vitamin B12-dependent ribonucleotide reductase [Acidimicrobiia bacterium]|nr:vitamin B12-dependent ribonucleotide reductase [Acidimicrobiia bacterium]MYG59099.1 vitamin B12-dependent ribonucleotide reductase [Acidimicrobiia bacterium]MYJ33233.1 vitamin B12-dependent ribonucleotide reductase [Acidimicrobiia bacterium]